MKKVPSMKKELKSDAQEEIKSNFAQRKLAIRRKKEALIARREALEDEVKEAKKAMVMNEADEAQEAELAEEADESNEAEAEREEMAARKVEALMEEVRAAQLADDIKGEPRMERPIIVRRNLRH